MILCIVLLSVCGLCLIGQLISSDWYYSTRDVNKFAIRDEPDPRRKHDLKVERLQYKISRFTYFVFGEFDSDCVRTWLFGLAAIALGLVLVITKCSNSSEITNLNARYDYYTTALEQGYIWNSQADVVDEQRKIAEMKAWVHKHLVRTFFKVEDVDALYDKVMKFEIPAIENTAKYQLNTTRNVIKTER